MTNEELFQNAKNIIATRRQKAHAKASAKAQEAQEKLPQIKEMQSESSALCAKAALLSVMGASKEEINQLLLKAKQLDEKREKLLKENDFESALLVIEYECKNCNDTGISNGKYCKCVHELTKTMRRDELNKKSPLSLCSFKDFDINKYPTTYLPEHGISAREHMGQLYEYCKAYAENFGLKNTNLYMCGFAGLGKTHLALSIANVALEKGYDVVYVSAQDAFERIEKERFAFKDGETLQSMQDAQLLILDDLGTEYISPYISSCLYSLVNSRTMPTIYTSNIVDDANLRRRYTEKIVSRLLGNCEVLTFCGDDIRLQNKI